HFKWIALFTTSSVISSPKVTITSAFWSKSPASSIDLKNLKFNVGNSLCNWFCIDGFGVKVVITYVNQRSLPSLFLKFHSFSKLPYNNFSTDKMIFKNKPLSMATNIKKDADL